jgi:pyridoxine kinase
VVIPVKKILTVQDISCIGKCSLTVALPVISAMGTETAVLPTAVLSTHTAFSGFTFRDLTDDIEPVTNHWKQEHQHFDAIYTGYLGSFRQLELVGKLIDDFRTPETLIFIDPCMADNGRLYTGFTPEFAAAMAQLCSKADVIVPNMTEACVLTGLPYRQDGYDEKYVKTVLTRLGRLGAKHIVLKGITTIPGKIGIMTYTPATQTVSSYFHEKLPENFHGTGDLFASVCVGSLMRGLSLATAISIAADFIVQCIKETIQHKNHSNYGVDFETVIPALIQRIQDPDQNYAEAVQKQSS